MIGLRRSAIAALAVWTAACGTPSAPPPSAKPAAGPQADAPAETVMKGKTDLYFYSVEPGAAGSRQPRFAVPNVEASLDADGVWSFPGAHAVIYGKDGSETHLDAGKGRIRQAKSGDGTGLEEAVLEGGVTLRVGDRFVQLEDLHWRNDDGIARSDKPVAIKSADTEITAASVAYDPDTKELTLKDAKGTLNHALPAPAASPQTEGDPST